VKPLDDEITPSLERCSSNRSAEKIRTPKQELKQIETINEVASDEEKIASPKKDLRRVPAQ
jgi:hypothetical protein